MSLERKGERGSATSQLPTQRRRKVEGCTSASSLLFILFVATLWLQLTLSNVGVPLYGGHIERYLASSLRFPPRTFVAYDEFFHKPPTQEEIEEFFRFDDEPSPATVPPVKPIWQCHENNRQGKLVYLHMYRSAGFSIRALLKAYAHLCGAGVAFVSHCVDVGLSRLELEEYWMNEGVSSPRVGKECWLSYLENRTGNEYPLDQSNAVSTKLLQENQVDIIGDHLPVGLFQSWKETDGRMTDITFITFFRNPLEKFVSDHLFSEKTKKQATSMIAEQLFLKASSRLQQGKFFDKISNHLISPEQKRWIDEEKIRWTYERRAKLTRKNLLRYNVVVGLVDKLPESLQLMEHLMDRNGNMTQMFQFFASTSKINSIDGGSIARSKEFTASVAATLRSNVTQYAVVTEYLKYEQQMYDFAVKVHQIQYFNLPKKKFDLFTES
jgi:hypothetical protein